MQPLDAARTQAYIVGSEVAGARGDRGATRILVCIFGEQADETVTTLAGLLNHVSGKVPASGDKMQAESHGFEVLEANQRKVLRVRIRKQMKAVPTNK